MQKFPRINTKRLTLGPLHWKDIPKIVEYAGNENIARTTLNIPHPYEAKDAVFWINKAYEGFEAGEQYTFAIRLRSTVEFIGGIGLIINKRFNSAEMGYWVAEPFWNQGYTTEAVAALLRFGFDALELNKIYASHITENPASGKVMLKNGMIREAELKEHYKKGDTYLSLVQYRLTRSEFEKQDS